MGAVASAIVKWLPILQIAEQYIPGIANAVIGMLHSTNGDPKAADWQALSDKVTNTPFDAPPTV